MMNRTVSLLRRGVAACLLTTLSATASATQEFTLLTESFAPLQMSLTGKSVAKNDGVSGLATDIIRQLFKNIGYTAEYHLKSSWDDAFNTAAATPGYGVYSTFRSAEREDMFKWVGPVYYEDWVLLARLDDEIKLNNILEAKKYSVGSFTFDAITDHLVELGITPKRASNDAVNIARLRNGSIDLWASSSLTGPYIASNFRYQVKPVMTFSSGEFWLAMHKSTDDAVIDTMNQELKNMYERGDVDKILAEYL
ncbi:substrate-binding periplasmic protein [Parendozoicomonas haliclonae]|uniref:Bacterial extracellular solute-binding protein, family 3 n=1 Tax=Parendozoicomonas haliclonae TaxID=1960125 RepID=A0A1X7ARR7_9GAMM|nr:ABC transporter substrate-binding protein [Parendozoicomonas haliclonae]SMA50097.1 Bacterial extracellular solute-binding protein, family 3 [Parendozoicomonas haliclonae]